MVPMLEQKKKKKKKRRKGTFFFKLGSAQRSHRNSILVGKGYSRFSQI